LGTGSSSCPVPAGDLQRPEGEDKVALAEECLVQPEGHAMFGGGHNVASQLDHLPRVGGIGKLGR